MMTCQNEYKPSCVGTKSVGVFDADDAEDVVDCLSKCRDNDHPAVCLCVDYSL